MRHRLRLLVAGTLFITACAGEAAPGPGGGGGPDAGVTPPAATCLVPASFGDVGALTNGSAVVIPQDAAQPAGKKIVLFNVAFTDPATPSAPPDILHLEFWDGLGVFAAGFKPGTFTIAGDEADFFRCSTCVVVAADFAEASNTPARTYMAKGGTVTLTAIDPTAGTGKLTGSIAGVSFGGVDVSGTTQLALTDGCTTAVSNMTFDLTVVAPTP